MTADYKAIDTVVNIWTGEALSHRPGLTNEFFVGKVKGKKHYTTRWGRSICIMMSIPSWIFPGRQTMRRRGDEEGHDLEQYKTDGRHTITGTAITTTTPRVSTITTTTVTVKITTTTDGRSRRLH